MNLLEVGSLGYQIGALGILAFTLSFLVAVRWWVDLLGKVLAFVFSMISLVLLLSAYRSLTQDSSPGFLAVRMVIYIAYGFGVWSGLLSFIWFQFFSPRVKTRTTRRESNREEIRLAARGASRDGVADDDSGRDR